MRDWCNDLFDMIVTEYMPVDTASEPTPSWSLGKATESSVEHINPGPMTVELLHFEQGVVLFGWPV